MIRPKNEIRHQRCSRSGAVLIIAIIALILCTAVCVSVFKTTVLRQDRFELRRRQQQTQLLADSAIDRAALQRRLNANYDQEVWAVEIDGEPGRCEIELKDDSSRPGHLKLTIRAQYPLETEQRCQVTIETTMATHASPSHSPTQAEAPSS